MAGAQVTTDILQLQKQRLGYQAISLTNYDNDSEPQIAAGSKVEIGGALFEFPALESITGWAGIAVSSDVYIKLVVSGTSVTAVFTITAPTWSTSKQGWYDSLDRYVAKLRKDGAGAYTDKGLLHGGPEVRNAAVGANAIRTLQIQDAAVTVGKLAANAVTAAKIDKTLDAGGSQVLAVSTPWTPPAGLYMFASNSGSVAVEIFQGGAWRGDLIALSGGLVLCDGTNVRLNPGGTGDTVYYRKLA